MKKTAGRRSFYAFFCLRAGGWVLRRPGGEQVLRLRARDGAFRAPARVTFFFCKKKVAKGNHSNLRFKDPLARGQAGVAPVGAGWGVSCPGTSNFLFCKKKVTKENHSNLWFKDPWRGEGKCKFGGADLAELVRWVTLLSVQGSLVPLAPLPLTAVRVGVGALVEWRLSNRAFAALRRQR